MLRYFLPIFIVLMIMLTLSAPITYGDSLSDELARLVHNVKIIQEGVLSISDALKLYSKLRSCSSGIVKIKVAKVIKYIQDLSNGELGSDWNHWNQLRLSLIDSMLTLPSDLANCNASLIYKALLYLYGLPTPSLWLPPADIGDDDAANIAYRVVYTVTGSRQLASYAASIASSDHEAALLLPGLYGVTDNRYWDLVLSRVVSKNGLCLIFSLVSEDAIPPSIADTALAKMFPEYYPLGPGAIIWAASRLYTRSPSSVFCLTAVAKLLDASNREVVEALIGTPFYRVEGAPRPLATKSSIDSLLLVSNYGFLSQTSTNKKYSITYAALTEINGSIARSPAAFAILMQRYYPDLVEELPAPTPTCRLAKEVLKNLIESNQPPTQTEWSIGIALSEICMAETGYWPFNITVAYQPFAPIDPWLLALAVEKHTSPTTPLHKYIERVSEKLWSGDIDGALEVKPVDDTSRIMYAFIRAGIASINKSLPALPILNETIASRLVNNSSIFFSEPMHQKTSLTPSLLRQLASMNTNQLSNIINKHGKELGQNMSSILTRIGFLSRSASLRPINSTHYIEYHPYARALATILASRSGLITNNYSELARIALARTSIDKVLATTKPGTTVTEPSASQTTSRVTTLEKLDRDTLSWSLGFNPTPLPPNHATTRGKTSSNYNSKGTRSLTSITGPGPSYEDLVKQLEETIDRIYKEAKSGKSVPRDLLEALKSSLALANKAANKGDYAESMNLIEKANMIANKIIESMKHGGTSSSSPYGQGGASKPGKAATPATSSSSSPRIPSQSGGSIANSDLLEEIERIKVMAKSLGSSEKSIASSTYTGTSIISRHMPGTGSKESVKSPGTTSSRLNTNSLFNELREALRNKDIDKAANIAEEIMLKGNPEDRAKLINLLSSEDSDMLQNIIAKIMQDAREGRIKPQDVSKISTLFSHINPAKLEKSSKISIKLPSHSFSPKQISSKIPKPSVPRITTPSTRMGGITILIPLLLGAIIIIILASRGLGLSLRRRRAIKLLREIKNRASRGAEASTTLRDLIIKLYREILQIYGEIYRPKYTYETHREYGETIPGEEKKRYRPVALVYEKAKFSFSTITPRDVEEIERALTSLREEANKPDRREVR